MLMGTVALLPTPFSFFFFFFNRLILTLDFFSFAGKTTMLRFDMGAVHRMQSETPASESGFRESCITS